MTKQLRQGIIPTHVLGSTGTSAITKAGIFNTASSGTLLCRTVFAAINKGANDTLAITWTVTIN